MGWNQNAVGERSRGDSLDETDLFLWQGSEIKELVVLECARLIGYMNIMGKETALVRICPCSDVIWYYSPLLWLFFCFVYFSFGSHPVVLRAYS